MKNNKVVAGLTCLLLLFCWGSYVKAANIQETQSNEETNGKKLFFLAETSVLFAKSEDIEGDRNFGTYGTGRFGLLYRIVPNFDLYIKGGGSSALEGEPWKSFVMVNFGFAIHYGPTYFGLGVEYNNQIKETGKKTNFYHPLFFGLEVFNTEKMAGSIIIERHIPMRYWIGAPPGFSRWYKFSLGFQLLF